jgi:hypothetical protein
VNKKLGLLQNLQDVHQIFFVSILVGDSDHDEGDNEEDTNDDDDEIKSEKKKRKKSSKDSNTFFPAGMLFFIIYGPYGVGVYNFDITSCLSTNSKGIDDQAKRYKNMNTESMIEKKKKDKTFERDTEPERGISAQNAMKFELAKEDHRFLEKQFERKSLMESFNVAVIMINRAESTKEEKDYWNDRMDEYAKVLAPTMKSVTKPSPIIDTVPRNTPSSVTSQHIKTDTLAISVITQSQRSVPDKKVKVDKDNKTIEVQDMSDSDSDSDVPIYYDPNDRKNWEKERLFARGVEERVKEREERAEKLNHTSSSSSSSNKIETRRNCKK